MPFLVEELLATAVRSGWETITDDVPGSVTASVATRLADLPPAARPLLTAAALLGRQFDWTLAAAAVGVGDDEAAELLRLAVRAQLVDVEGAGFRFRHALTRDAVLAAALPTEQSVGRGPCARRARSPSIRTCPASGARSPPQLAAAAGHADRAAALWLEAAERALDDGSLASAEALATRARDTGATGDAALGRRLGAAARVRAVGADRSRRRAGRRAAGPAPPIPATGPTSTSCSAPPTWPPAGGTTPRPTPAPPGRWRPPTSPCSRGPTRWPPMPRWGAPSPTSPSPSLGPPSRAPAPPASRRWSARPSR